MLTMIFAGHTHTGILNADGSFEVTGVAEVSPGTYRGVFATDGGRTVIRDGVSQRGECSGTFEATKQ
jgi:hypothetical protein